MRGSSAVAAAGGAWVGRSRMFVGWWLVGASSVNLALGRGAHGNHWLIKSESLGTGAPSLFFLKLARGFQCVGKMKSHRVRERSTGERKEGVLA